MNKIIIILLITIIITIGLGSVVLKRYPDIFKKNIVKNEIEKIERIKNTDTDKPDQVIDQEIKISDTDPLESLTVAGNRIFNSLGKIPELTMDYFGNLDGSNITDVDAVYLGGISSADFLRSNQSDTAKEVITFAAKPDSTDVSGGPLYINPTSSESNYTLFGVAVDGSAKLRLDAEGDMHIAGTLTASGGISGTLNPNFTNGSLVFQSSAGLTQNNSNLFWDNSNYRLGIGTASPAYKLDVNGTINSADLITKGPMVDVRAYGAVCDGSTDDTAAFTAAAAAVKSHGTIFIPPSDNGCLITGISISPENPFSIKGVGKASKIVVSGENYGIIIGADINTVMRGISIEGISIEGTSSGKGGIRFGPEVSSLQAQMTSMTIKDIDISGFTSSSVSHTVLSGAPAATGGSGIFFSNGGLITMINVYSHHNYHGEQESGIATATTVSHINCAFRENAAYGVYLKTARSFSYTNGTVFESNGDSGFYAVTPAGTNNFILDLSLIDVYFENNLTTTGSYQAVIGNDYGNDVRRFRADHVIFNGKLGVPKNGMKVDRGREVWLRDVASGDALANNLTTTNSTSVWVMGGRDDDGADVLDSNTISMDFNPSDGGVMNTTPFAYAPSSSTAGFQVLGSSSTPMINVDTTNNRVGMGTATPFARLTIKGDSSFSQDFLHIEDNATRILEVISDSSGNGIFRLRDTNGTLKINLSSSGNSYFTGGNIGIGSSDPQSKLQVTGGGLCVGSDANCNSDNNSEGVVYSSSTSMTTYDVAENYPSKDTSLTAGEVIELDPANPVFVQRAQGSNARLLGVISTEPAVLLGGFNGKEFKNEFQVAVALSGRVPVKIDPNSAPISIGEPITASSIPGKATRATQNSWVLGKALENWNPGEGKETLMMFVETYRYPQDSSGSDDIRVRGLFTLDPNEGEKPECNEGIEGSLRYSKGDTGHFEGCRKNGGGYEWVTID